VLCRAVVTRRDEQWSTCPQDRPLFVQFCANDPDVFVASASMVQVSSMCVGDMLMHPLETRSCSKT
jgi:tRNA-dihydrouridine synthase